MSPTSFASLAVACVVFISCVSALPLSLLGGSTCSILSGSLPQICTCVDGADNAATLTCSVNPMGLDQMSLIGTVQPCNKSGATIDLSVQDTKYNVSYAFPEFDANTNGSVPVPGISLTTPFGSAGVYANYNISGDASEVTFGLNIDLCVATFILTTCASTLGVPGMPVTLINGTYDFSSLCS